MSTRRTLLLASILALTACSSAPSHLGATGGSGAQPSATTGTTSGAAGSSSSGGGSPNLGGATSTGSGPNDAGPPAPVPVALIDMGSAADYTDAQGRVWKADTLMSGAPYEGIVDRGNVPIAGTSDPRIYDTEHYCMNTFEIPIQAGTYTVKLHFAETKMTAVGQRIFDVDVEGHALLGLDVLQKAGAANTALVETFDDVTVSDGSLTLAFTGHVDCAEINGVEVLAKPGGTTDGGAPMDGGAMDGGGPKPSGFVPQGYKLVMSDEFEGTVLDQGRWMTQYPCGCTKLNDEIEHYTNDGSNLELGGGTITILGKQDLSSGVFTGQASFKYGYFELRAKMAVSKGAWPAYWLTSDSRWPPEWDIFEVVTDPTVVYQTPHPVAGDTVQCDTGPGPGTINVNTDFHVYGFLWTATDITWTIDGVQTKHCSINAPSANDFMWVQHNVAIGGQWPGNPDSTTVWPLELVIDYSRVYQDASGQIAMHAASGPLVDPDSPQ